MKNGTTVALVVALAAVVYFMTRKTAVPIPGANSIGNVGNQSHVPVSSTGVAIASLLGSNISSWFGGGATSNSQIPVDHNTPITSNSTLWNPVQSSPAVLPYSYKQQTVDTPSLLGTDDLFTPSYDGSGSSGSYADDSTGLNSGNSDILNYGFGE